MLLLAIESSGPACSAALAWTGPGGQWQVEQRREAGDRGQADRLIPLIDRLLEEAGRRYIEVDVIATGAGPGSFTGVRTAVAAARGLALAIDRPVLPVTTLETLAWLAAPSEPAPLLAVLDARRSEVYAQLFTADRQPARQPRAMAFAEAVAQLQAPCWLVGTGAPLLTPHLDPALVAGVEVIQPDASGVARAAEALLARGAGVKTGFELSPIYLREPDARPMTAPQLPGGNATPRGGP